MPFHVTLHYDNAAGFAQPHLWVWYSGSDSPDDLAATGVDAFGHVFDVDLRRPTFELSDR